MNVGIWYNWMQNPIGPAAVARRKLISGLGHDASVTIQHESLPWVNMQQTIQQWPNLFGNGLRSDIKVTQEDRPTAKQN